MTIAFNCENCGKDFKTDEGLAGKKCKCRQCGHIFLIPTPRAAGGSSGARAKALQTFGDDAPAGGADMTTRPRPAAPRPARPESPPKPKPRPQAAPRPAGPSYLDDDDPDDPYALDEVAAPAKPVFPEDEELPLPRAPRPVAPQSKKKKKRGPSRGDGWTPFVDGLPGQYYLGLFVVLFILFIWSLIAPTSGSVLLVLAAILGAGVPVIYGSLGMMVLPFYESVACGLMNLFLPIYPLYYLITRWDAMRGAFLSYISGVGVFVVTMVGMGLFLPALNQARHVARQDVARQPNDGGQRVAGPVFGDPPLDENQAEAAPVHPPALAPVPVPVAPFANRPGAQIRPFGGRIAPPSFPPPGFNPRGRPNTPQPAGNPDETVTLVVLGLNDQETSAFFGEKLGTILDGAHFRGFGGGGRMTYTISPVSDVDEFARKITWAKVTGVKDRTITVRMSPPRAGERRPPDTDFVGQVLFDLKSPTLQDRKKALSQLANKPPDPTRRAEVARAVEPMLKDTDAFARSDAAKALGGWGGPENTQALVDALRDPAFNVVWAVFDALAALKDPAAAAPVAEFLTIPRDRGKASEALKAIGSSAEAAVMKYLDHGDGAVRREACKVLEVIGTDECVPALQELLRKTNGQGFDAMAARDALRNLNAPDFPARKKAAPGRRR